MAAVIANVVEHLRRKLTGGSEHQSTNLPTTRPCSMAEFLQHGQGEARRFPSAGLSGSHQIATAEHRGDGLLLNG